MKLLCSVIILNRLLPTLHMNSSTKHKNAVISVAKLSKSSEVTLVLVTQNNKAGVRYKILKNIEKTFGQFSNEGKCTIRFREPPHDLCITADIIPLKNFMLFLKKVYKGEESNIPVSNKEITLKSRIKSYKLDVKKKEDYPVLKGFPSTLQSLLINDCKLQKFDTRILKLKNLISLNLGRNEIKTLPIELGSLAIRQLILADNDLNNENWFFLSGTLSKSLESLDLSGNKIKFFPSNLSRFYSLKSLKVSRNSLSYVPFRLCLLPLLQNLDLSYNYIDALPETIRRKGLKRLDTLDVSGNENLWAFKNDDISAINYNFRKERHPNYVQSLLELSGQRIINSGIQYSEENLPIHLVRLLDNASQCTCGKTTVRNMKKVYYIAESRSLANTFVSSQTGQNVRIIFFSCSAEQQLSRTKT